MYANHLPADIALALNLWPLLTQSGLGHFRPAGAVQRKCNLGLSFRRALFAGANRIISSLFSASDFAAGDLRFVTNQTIKMPLSTRCFE
jgi:hypothetical protein